MAETIMGASGQNLWHIDSGGAALVIGSLAVDVTVADYVSIVGSPNYNLPVSLSSLLGSVEVSSIRNALPAGTALLGSVIASPVGTYSILGSVAISNATINVDVTVGDYVSIVGSPNYNLPTTTVGSVQVSSITGALPAGTNLIGSVVADIVGLTTSDYLSIVGSPNYNLPTVNVGSVEVSSIRNPLPAGTLILGSVKIEDGGNSITVDGTVTANLAAGTNLIGSVVADIVGLSTSDYLSIVGSPNYSLPVIGSVQVSSIVGALPAGTALLGSVVADIVGLSTSDYLSIVGSPNYSLPIVGSVQVSSLVGALPAGTNNIGDVDVLSIAAGTTLIGSVVSEVIRVRDSLGSVQVSSIVGALPAGTNAIGYIGSLQTGILGSVNVSSITGALPAGTALLGSANVRISDTPPAWTGTGSTIDTRLARLGSSLTFAWVGALTGSVIGIPPTGSRYDITNIVMSTSGQGITTMFVNADNNANRIAKAYLANFGGFVSNYGAAPFQLPINGSLMITTAATGFTPAGDVTVDFRMSA